MAERAVRAGREILRELQILNPRLEAEHGLRLQVRVGIHTGPVVVGELGGGGKPETMALGDTLNVAARLEAFAEPDTLVVSDATLQLVAGPRELSLRRSSDLAKTACSDYPPPRACRRAAVGAASLPAGNHRLVLTPCRVGCPMRPYPLGGGSAVCSRPSRSPIRTLFAGSALLAVIGFAAEASAVPVVDLIWTATTGAGATGGSSIVAAPGDVLELTMFLTVDPPGTVGYKISLEFDRDGANELDLVSVVNPIPPGFTFSIPLLTVSDSGTGGPTGRIHSFNALTSFPFPGPPAVSGTFAIGVVEFSVNGSVANDGDDVFSGFLNPTIADGLLDATGAGNILVVDFRGAAVNVPEPGTAALLLAGLVALAARTRRHR